MENLKGFKSPYVYKSKLIDSVNKELSESVINGCKRSLSISEKI